MSFKTVRFIAKESSLFRIKELSIGGGERDKGIGEMEEGIGSRGIDRGDLVFDEGVGVRKNALGGAGVAHWLGKLLEGGGWVLSGIRLLWLYWRGTKSAVVVSRMLKLTSDSLLLSKSVLRA